MKILGLPGISPATKNWMQDLITALDDGDSDATILEYRHWSDGDGADIDHEIGRLEKVSADLVIAKSFGTAVATGAFDAVGFRPKQAVFIGCPLKRHGLDNFGRLCRFAASVPTLFIQQTADFVGSYRDLGDVVGSLDNATTREVPGDDHVYADIEQLRGLIRSAF